MRHRKIEPAHPGELLREVVIPATGRSKTDIARLLKLSRQTLYDVLGARQPVTPQIAVRLGKLFRRRRGGMAQNAYGTPNATCGMSFPPSRH
jgi:addiction module HigA family antidote